jgi:hypothetical protein
VPSRGAGRDAAIRNGRDGIDEMAWLRLGFGL